MRIKSKLKPGSRRCAGLFEYQEDGLALVITLVALSLFSLLGLFVALNSSTNIRISDNYESQIQAQYAARAGLEHAQELLRGLDFNDLLKGPDGTYDTSAAYMSQARAFSFRNPISWYIARSLNILDPAGDVGGLPDDGVINTGRSGPMIGTVLIPITGIEQTAANPYGPGRIVLSRYSVKVSDNNGETAELARDSLDNPFFDGDGVVIVRSIGIAQTIRESTSGRDHRNSVAVYESRFKHRGTFRLDAALVAQGVEAQPSLSLMFNGNGFRIEGGAGNAGIAAIDADTADLFSPASQISSQLTYTQTENVRGMGLRPSIRDITIPVSADADKCLLLDRSYLWGFVTRAVPRFADNVFQGTQSWANSGVPDLGKYDPSLPLGDPSQHPKVTFVNGDLDLAGDIEGGGLLVVTGKLTVNGRFTFNGLILAVGKADLDARAWNPGLRGGIYLAGLTETGGVLSWGIAKITVSQETFITFDGQAIEMAISLIPPSQLGFREISSAMDP